MAIMERGEAAKLSPMKAIRAKCLDCCCNQPNEVRLCPIDGCPLYQYRFGHNPRIKREKLEGDALEAARERGRRLAELSKAQKDAV